MNYIIALSGKSNCGKTATLNKVIESLSRKYTTLYLDNNSIDWSAMFDINGIKVGITASGDNEETIKRKLDLIKQKTGCKCNIFVCACHTHGNTIEFLNNFRARKTIITKGDVVKSYNCIDKKREELNKYHKKMIINEIMRIIENELCCSSTRV